VTTLSKCPSAARTSPGLQPARDYLAERAAGDPDLALRARAEEMLAIGETVASRGLAAFMTSEAAR
jgi:hypothetical protein